MNDIPSNLSLQSIQVTFSPRIPSSPFIRDLDPVLFEKLNSTHLLRERGFDFYSTNPYDLPPRVGFINRHFGCHSDFTHLSKQLGFNFTEFSVDELYRHALPWLDVHDWLSEKEANFDSFHNLADLFCSRFDLVVVGKQKRKASETCLELKPLILFFS